jgi:hypothetical protein
VKFEQAVRYGQALNGPPRYPMPKYGMMNEEKANAIRAC